MRFDLSPTAADAVPRRQDRLTHPGQRSKSLGQRDSGWDPITRSSIETNALRYVEQVRLSLRPVNGQTHRATSASLRHLARRPPPRHPLSCAELERHHIEAFKTSIWAPRPNARTGKPLARTTIKEHLINLGCFFERTTELGLPRTPPPGRCCSPATSPASTDPCPDSSTMLPPQSSPAPPGPSQTRIARLCVEILARTGIRLSELLGTQRRCRRADRLRLLAADPRRQAPQRPLHPAPPRPQDPPRRLDRQPSPQRPAQRPAPTRTRAAHHQAPRRQRPRPHRQQRRHRPRHPTPAPPHARCPGHQPGHEPRGHRRPCSATRPWP